LLTTITDCLESCVTAITQLGPPGYIWKYDFNVRAFFALTLVALVSGTVGSLVVSNRMAFFSDALAHCAFAGVAVGLFIALLFGVKGADFHHEITLIRVGFGIVFGLMIAYVHASTGLPSDTVIGVFFAAALGLGGIFARAVRGSQILDLEKFIFGDPLAVSYEDILWLILLALLTALFLAFWYNSLLFGSFNASLARSRRVPAELSRYLFIVLLGVIVNLCQQTVGVLLINGLLIVPGATAANLSQNMRQLLWRSLAISLICGVSGLWLSWEIYNWFNLEIGVGGMVLVLSVVMFALSMLVRTR
jgi:zinc transport system permease protein